MEISGLSNLNPQASLSVGDKVLALVVKSEGNNKFILNIGGKLFEALSDSELEGSVRVEITQLKPSVIVKLIAENKLNQSLLNMKAEGTTSSEGKLLGLLAKEMISFEQSDIVKVMKQNVMTKLEAFIPDEFKRVLKDSGLFFENKLLEGASLKSDAKLATMMSGNDTAKGAVTKMQIANILLDNSFFAFFDNDELDFDNGVMRFKKGDDGELNLYMKLDFTNLGLTVLSFAKNFAGGYNINIRTKKDISEFLEDFKIDNCALRWSKLTKVDKSFFNIRKEDLKLLSGFDMKA